MIARLAPASLQKDASVLFAWATASHMRVVACLIAISLVAFLPGFFNIPPIDRDEARFAQATKQMIESGDYIDIRYQDEVRYKKPVGIYWLQAGVVRAAEAVGVPQARTTIWLYRIPSLIGGIGAVLLTYWAALAFVSRRSAFLAALMMATCLLLNVEARLAKTDATLLLCCVAAMGVMARAYLTQCRTRHFVGSCPRPVDGGRGWCPAEGAAHPDGGRAARTVPDLRRPVDALAAAAASARRRDLGSAARAAMVRRHHGAGGGKLLPGVGRAGPAVQDLQGAGNPRRTARLLPRAVLAHFLARSAIGCCCRARRVAIPA